MHPILSTILLLAVSAAAMLPAFPILIFLQSYFPDLPAFFSIDSAFLYVVQSTTVLFAGLISMCVYSDIACPLAIKGFAAVFSRM